MFVTLLAVALAGGAAAEDMRHERAPRPALILESAPAQTGASWTEEQTLDGKKISVRLATLDGTPLAAHKPAQLRIAVTDVATGAPIKDDQPLAWMIQRRSEQVADETSCDEKVAAMSGGMLSARPDVDFNAFRILVLDGEQALGVVNPQVAFSRTQLESVVALPGRPYAFEITPDGTKAFVSLPTIAGVAVVDLDKFAIKRLLSPGPGARPARVAIEPDGARAWVGRDDANSVLLIDARTGDAAGSVEVGQGPHQFAFSLTHAIIANETSHSLTIVKRDTLATRQISLPVAPKSITTHGERAFVGGEPTLTVVELGTGEVNASLDDARGLSALTLAADGKLLLGLHRATNELIALDTQTLTVRSRIRVVEDSDDIVVGPESIIVHSASADNFSVLQPRELEEGRPSVAQIQYGLPRIVDAVAPTSGPMVAVLPQGHGMLVANPSARAAAYYMAGMNAPMGSLKLYAQSMLGLSVIDRSLAQTAPGVYETIAKLGEDGAFDLPVAFQQPRRSVCFRIAIAPAPENARAVARPYVVELLCAAIANAETATRIAFRLLDRVTMQPAVGLKDLEITAFAPPSNWRQRRLVKETDPGVYETEWTFTRRGPVTLAVSSPSLQLASADATISMEIR